MNIKYQSLRIDLNYLMRKSRSKEMREYLENYLKLLDENKYTGQYFDTIENTVNRLKHS